MNDLNVRAGRVVAEQRKLREIPQEELARHLGVTRTSISNIEHGKQAMSLATFCKVANYLHIDANVLLEHVLQPKHAKLALVTEAEEPDKGLRDYINNMLTENMKSSLIISGGSNEQKKD